jgi:hypothetical protein
VWAPLTPSDPRWGSKLGSDVRALSRRTRPGLYGSTGRERGRQMSEGRERDVFGVHPIRPGATAGVQFCGCAAKTMPLSIALALVRLKSQQPASGGSRVLEGEDLFAVPVGVVTFALTGVHRQVGRAGAALDQVRLSVALHHHLVVASTTKGGIGPTAHP